MSAGDENLDFSGTRFSTGSSGFPGSAVVFGVLFLVTLVLITVGFGTLGGSGVFMVSLPGHRSQRLRVF